MVSGRAQLRAWIERAKLTDRAAATLLGIHYTFLSQILGRTRERGPSLRTAVRIERVTGIPVEAWMPTDVDSERTTMVGTGRKSRIGKA